tara:strand:+ start:2325 stop:2798 length:474 start_codon:yes stop_codon:yes gene_type:complete
MDREMRDQLKHVMVGGYNIERNISIYERRSQHPYPTLKSVGLEFGVSQERVRQIVIRADRDIKRLTEACYIPPDPIPHYSKAPHIILKQLMLSWRIQHCFINENYMTVEHVLSQGQLKISRIPDFGNKSLKEVISVFKRIGVDHLWTGTRMYEKGPK